MTQLQIQRQVTTRTARIRVALETIIEASIDWSNEIRDALSESKEKERIDFIQDAGLVCAELGRYIAAAGGAR